MYHSWMVSLVPNILSELITYVINCLVTKTFPLITFRAPVHFQHVSTPYIVSMSTENHFWVFKYLLPSLLGGVVYGEEKLVIDDQKAESFVWEGYGLKMEIPAHAAGPSGATPLEIGMVAMISGQFEFPPGSQLVSGVYAVGSSRKPARPVVLQMEHSVDMQSLQEGMSLCFNRASPSQHPPPYKFEYLDQGDFPISSRYGSIQLEEFSFIATVLR